MKSFFNTLATLFTSSRSTLFMAMFLLSGNYHQAVEKQTDVRTAETDLSFLYAPSVEFTEEYTQYVEHSIDSLLKRRGFNGSVLIAHKGAAVYNKSMGYARHWKKQEFGEKENVFQLASVGKQFTALSALILYERGLIDLDDPVDMHIEGFPYPDITIRHLMNHTSGLQNYFYVIEHFWKEDYLPVHQDMLELFIKQSLPLNFTPGRLFSYSNTGYVFLALLVEKVSGELFANFVHKNIFEPLKMNNSFVFHPSMNLEQLSSEKNLTMGYERMGRRLREIPVDYVDGITGDKGIFSCTEDLLKWDNAIENNLLISAETKQGAFEGAVLKNGRRINYGFGYRIKPKENIIYHNGWWRGYRTAYVRLPDNTLIVILNNTNASIIGLENQIRKVLDKCKVPVFPEEQQQQLLASS